MVKRRITEADITRLIRKIIKEAENERVELNFSNTFPSGQYDERYIKMDEFNTKLEPILNFIKTHPKNQIEINVTGGESQVTNPKGFEEKGSLAKKRSQVISDKIKEILQSKVDLGNIKFTVGEPVIGQTPYQKGDDPNKQEYTNEQFIKVTISVVGEKEKPNWCSRYLESKGVKGDPTNGFTAKRDVFAVNGDVGKIRMVFDSYTVPDMFVVQYAGKTYHSGFVGNGSEKYTVALGTVLATQYGGNLHENFANYQTTDIDRGVWSTFQEMMKNKDDYNEFLDNMSSVMEINKNNVPTWSYFKQSGYYKKLRWKNITPAVNSIAKTAGFTLNQDSGAWELLVPKVKGQDEVILWNIAPLGTTKWRVYFYCEP